PALVYVFSSAFLLPSSSPGLTLHLDRFSGGRSVAYKGATGKESALYDTIFTTVPGAPAYVGKASNYRANVPALNVNINLKDHNAVSGPFRFIG
ncbi:MAG: hypothetical protein BZY88_06145, partial [SAR202 cluster bacterium Io17-Chloro-G9]